MNKFETYGRSILPAAVLFNFGALAVHSQPKQTIAAKAICRTVPPKYEEIVTTAGVLIRPESGGNKQYYLIAEGRTPDVAYISQEVFHQDKTESEKVLDIRKLAVNHSLTVSFHDDAPGVTMEFRGERFQTSGSSGMIGVDITPMICKPPGLIT